MKKIPSLTMCMLLLAGVTVLLPAPVLRADYEDLGAGGRSSGMGNAFTGIADDCDALLFNPAGMSNLSRPTLMASHQKLYWGLDDESDIGNSFVGFVYPLLSVPPWLQKQAAGVDTWGAIGAGMQYRRGDTLYSESTIMLAYANSLRAMGRPLHAGVTAKVLSKKYASSIYTENAIDFSGNSYGRDPVFDGGYGKTNVAFDAGALYDISRTVTLGMALKNINQPDTALSSARRLPLSAVLGASVRLRPVPVLLAGDVEYCDNAMLVHIGAEMGLLKQKAALRAGAALSEGKLYTITSGVSYTFGNALRIDYAFILPAMGIRDTYGSHILSLSSSFGTEASKFMTDNPKPEAYKEGQAFFKDKAYMAALLAFRNVQESQTHRYWKEKAGIYIRSIIDKMQRIVRTSAPAASVPYAKGVIAFSNAGYQQALEHFSEYANAFPGNAEAGNAVAHVQRVINNEKEREIEQALKEANAAFLRSQYTQATDVINRILSISPQHKDALMLAQLIREKQEQEKAARVQQHYTDGLMRFTEGKYKEAILDWQQCLKLNPGFSDASAYITRAEAAMKDPEKKTEVPRDELKAEDHYNKALLAYSEGKIEKAVEELKKAITFNPNKAELRESLKRIQLELQPAR